MLIASVCYPDQRRDWWGRAREETGTGEVVQSTMDTNNLIESIDARECFRRSHATSLCSSFLFKSRSFVSPVLSDLFATLSLARGEGERLTPFSLIVASNQITVYPKKKLHSLSCDRIGRQLYLSPGFAMDIYRVLGTRALSLGLCIRFLHIKIRDERHRWTRTRFAMLLRYH